MNRRTLLACASVIAIVVISITTTAFAAAPRAFAPVQKGFAASGSEVLPYAPDRIIVKFRDTSMQRATIRVPREIGVPAPGTLTGLASVDELGREFKVTRIARAFTGPMNAAEAARIGVERTFMMHLAPGADVEAAARRYEADPNVEYATPDWVAFPAAVPTDPMYAGHWGHNNTAQLPGLDWGGTYDHTLPTTVGTPGFDANAQAGWDGTAGYGSASVIIAIIDSGVNLSHPDLSLVTGYDYGDNDSNPEDNSASAGHGTCCAGVAAALVNNGLGACGAAPACKIMPLKVANSAGSMYFSAIVNAIYYAADHGAHVISMSLGAAISSDASTDAAILYAYNAGVTILAATGNENKTVISYPAVNQYVIGVGAASPCGDRKRSSSLLSEVNPGVSTDPRGYTCDGERWWGSNYGTTTANAAGAVDVLGPTILPTTDIQGSAGYRSGDYEPFFNGTSCATPYVAGVCALIKSKNPTYTPAQIKSQLTGTAQDVVNAESVAGWDRYSGFGMVDMNGAVGGGGGCTPLVTANFSGSPTSGTAPLTVNFTDLSTGSPTSWSWNFGDGGTSTVQNPSHAYAAAGTYNVTLTATNACGSDAEVKNAYVTVTGGTTWTTITYDNFESGMGTFTDGGTDMSRYTGGTYSWEGVASADIQDNSGTPSSFYTTTARNVSSYQTQEITFYFRALSMETGEDFFVEYYNGTAYQIVATYVSGTSFVNGSFYTATVTLRRSTYTFPTNARIRFRCDASGNDDDVYVDAITWRATTTALPASPGPAVTLVKPGGAVDPTLAPEASTPALANGLEQNHPNPFNPGTTISFTLASERDVQLEVFDLSGRRVATLVDGVKSAGRHDVDFDASSLASGVYFYRLRAGDFVQQRKMVLLK